MSTDIMNVLTEYNDKAEYDTFAGFVKKLEQ